MSISIPRDEEELYLRNHHGGGQNLFPLRTLVDGEVITPEIFAQPWVLTLTSGEGQVEICFERPGTLRMRGQGLGFQMGKRNLVYSSGPNLVTFNMPYTRRYQVEVLHGSIEIRQLVPTQPVFPRIAVVSPAEDGRWELAIDAFDSTWVRPERASFDDCLATAQKAFTEFLEAMPPVRPQDRITQQLATYVDWCSSVEPRGLVKRPSILMSKNWMNSVWSWDHCFNAMAMAKAHPELALDQMLTMCEGRLKSAAGGGRSRSAAPLGQPSTETAYWDTHRVPVMTVSCSEVRRCTGTWRRGWTFVAGCWWRACRNDKTIFPFGSIQSSHRVSRGRLPSCPQKEAPRHHRSWRP